MGGEEVLDARFASNGRFGLAVGAGFGREPALDAEVDRGWTGPAFDLEEAPAPTKARASFSDENFLCLALLNYQLLSK